MKYDAQRDGGIFSYSNKHLDGLDDWFCMLKEKLHTAFLNFLGRSLTGEAGMVMSAQQ